MPIYEYRCSACGFEKDALQKMSDKPLVDCPECGKPTLVKLISAAGFQLKGSGWYATDFKGSGNKPPAKPAAESKGETGATNDSSAAKGSDAPAAKAESATSSASGTSSTSSTPATPGTTSGSGD